MAIRWKREMEQWLLGSVAMKLNDNKHYTQNMQQLTISKSPNESLSAQVTSKAFCKQSY
jgi:hypothetical protein